MGGALDRIIRLLEETCGVLALAVMFVSIVVQVIFRYLFTPLVWPFELSIYMYICLIYLGAALAARHDSHVAFDVLFNALPVPVQRVLSAGLRVFGAAVLATLIVPGIQFMRQSHIMRSASLHIPWSFLVLVYLVSIVLMIGHLAAGAVRDWRGTRTGES
ncbi:MAG: TRAP transporter small permease subunit [candidate division NC10 bacterium]|nr:TRAP transporter small permease subunit [candidate division NC10 bacterium]MBI2455379.1 TRAP transporter small permease subunit [candidate division NC10 bacterium]MBI3122153.1 TRAP transporter small permease subunit [candidate division NC10 bacterium]